MNHSSNSDSRLSSSHTEQAITLALSLAQAEAAIHAFSSGQTDAVIDADGRPYLLRPAQEKLRQSEDRLQALFDRVNDAVVVADRGGIIISRNRGAVRLFGRDGMMGQSLFDMVHPADLLPLYFAFFNVIEGIQEEATAPVSLQTMNGPYLPLEVSTHRLENTVPSSLVVIFRDCAQRGAAPAQTTPREAALTVSLLAKDRFLAVLSHELRTPLTPILLGLAELQNDNVSSQCRRPWT